MPEYARETSPIRESQKTDLPNSPWRIKTSPRKYTDAQPRINRGYVSPSKTYSVYGAQSPSKSSLGKFETATPTRQGGSS
jgi:hypothetical protein